VTTPTLYANAYQVPSIGESGMYLRTIIHRKLLSAPTLRRDHRRDVPRQSHRPIRWTKTLYDANNYDYINLLKGFETLAVHSSKQRCRAGTRSDTKIQAEDMIDLIRGPDDKVSIPRREFRIRWTKPNSIFYTTPSRRLRSALYVSMEGSQTDDKCTEV
jgi:hypothetical protein